MEGKFDPKYFFVGAGKEDWYKALGNGWRLLVIGVVAILLICGGIFIKNLFFGAPQGNVSKQGVNALPFSKIEKVEQNSTQTLVLPQRRFHVGGWFGGGSSHSNNMLYSSGNRDKTNITLGIFGWIDLGK